MANKLKMWGQNYSFDDKGNIYKNGNFVSSKNYNHLPSQALERAKRIKSGKQDNGNLKDVKATVTKPKETTGSTKTDNGLAGELKKYTNRQQKNYNNMNYTQAPFDVSKFLQPNPEMDIEDFADKFGFDYSRDYAEDQAEAIEQSKRDGLEHSQRKIDANVMGAAENLDRNYFLQALQQNQQQVNRGLNAGLEADQDLRLAMARQANLGDVYRDANVENARINDELARLDAESIAYADQLYNNRRQQGFDNTMQYNQYQDGRNAQTFDNAMNYWGMLEDIRRNNRNFDRETTLQDRNFAMAEGELTGRYIPDDAQNMLNQLLNLKQQAESGQGNVQQLSNRADTLRNALATYGYNPSQFGAGVSYQDALQNIANIGQGRNTLERDQSIWDNQYRNNALEAEIEKWQDQMNLNRDELAFNQDKWNDQLGLSRDELNFNQDKWNDQFGLDKQRFEFESDMERIMSELEAQQKETGTNEQSTNAVIARIYQANSRDEALQYIADNMEVITNTGADVKEIRQALDDKFPAPGGSFDLSDLGKE